jgi:hypothetical protein
MITENLKSKFSFLSYLIAAVILPSFIAAPSLAATNSGITYQGRIVKPDGTALEDSSVQFKIQIRSPDTNNCLLYEEVQVLDMTASGGLFALTINDGSGTRTDTAAYNIDQIFANRGTFNFAPSDCAQGNTYSPNTSDGRRLVVAFKDQSLSSYETIPTQNLNFIPQAIEAKQIGGYQPGDLLRVDKTYAQTVAAFTYADYTNLVALLAGTSTQYLSTSTTQGAALPSYASNPGAPSSGSLWYDATLKQVKYFDGSTIKTFGTASGAAGVSSILTGTGLTGGPITASGTISIANGGVDTPQIASSAITDPKIASGTITGDKFDPALTISTSGNITASQVSTTSTSVRSLLLYDPGAPGIHKITLSAPASLPADYSLALPVSAPAASQIMQSDALGNLSWTSISAAVTSFLSGSAAAPGWAITGNSNTGLFSPASNTISLSAGGLEGLRVNTSGGATDYIAVTPGGVSTTQISTAGTDASVDLEIAPKGAGNLIIANGNLGIGVANPPEILSVNGNISLASSIVHAGNAGTYFNFGGGGNQIILVAANRNIIGGSKTAFFGIDIGDALESATGKVSIHNNSTFDLNVGIGTTNPLARLHLPAGGPTASSAPLMFTTGALLATPASGAVEYDGNYLYITNASGARQTISTSGSAAPTSFLSGSAAAPGWSVTGNTNTGLFSPASNSISLSAGGYEALRAIASASAPTDYIAVTPGGVSSTQISTAGTDANVDLKIAPKGSGNTIFANGNVGIGSAAPTVALDVVGAINASGNVTGAFGLYGGGLGITHFNSTVYSPIGATALPPSVLTTTATNALDGTYMVYDMTVRNSAGVYQGSYFGPVSASGASVYSPSIVFGQQTGAATYTERMRIDTTGYVGIGTTTPNAKLDVNGKFILEASTPGSGYAGFAAPASMATSTIWTLPSADGASGTTLATNGSGILSWASAAAAPTTFLAVAGTASAPSHSFIADTSTGLYDAAVGTLGFAASGTVVITAASNVVNIPVTTNSNNVSTGALVVAGGVGFGGNINAQGYISGGNNNVGVYSAAGGASQYPSSGMALAMNNFSPTSSGYSILRMSSKNSNSNFQYGYLAIVSASGATQYSPNMVFGVSNGAASYQEQMRLDTNGNVGIGTTTPSAKLDVNGKFVLEASTPGTGYAGFAAPASMATSTIWTLPAADGASGTTLATNGSGILSWVTAAAAPTSFLSGSAAAPGWAVTGNTNTGLFSAASNTLSIATGGFEGLRVNQASGSDYVTVAPGGASTTSIGVAGVDTNIDLKLSGKGSGNTIIASGNVGIGTTAPTALLNTSGGLVRFEKALNAEVAALELNNPTNGAGYGSQIEFAIAGNTLAAIGHLRGATSNDGIINFKTKSGSGFSEQMRIDQNGNVGIGTTTPSAKLDVAGKFVLEASTPGSGYAGFAAPASMATASVIWTLPTADGASGSVLGTSGAGVLSWVNSLVSGGTLLAANGSVGSPSHSFTNDTTTGMYLPSVNTLAFSASGTQVISAASNVVNIPITTPSSSKTTGALTIGGGLGVAGALYSAGINSSGGLNTSGGVNVAYTPTNSSVPYPYNGNSPAATVFNRNTSSLDSSGAFYIMGANNTAGTVQYAYMGAITTPGAASYSSAIVFGAKNAASGYGETMRIDPSGNVGIGTTTPTSNLAFTGQSAQTIRMERESTAATAGNDLTVQAGGATLGGTDLAAGNLNLSAGIATGTGAGTIYFNVPYGNSGTADRMPTAYARFDYTGLSINIPGNTLHRSQKTLDVAGSEAIYGVNNLATPGAQLFLMNQHGNSSGWTNGVTSLNDQLGEINFEGTDAGFNAVTMAKVRSVASNVGNGTGAGNLYFATASGAVLTDQMTILSSGNVGINTPSPTVPLDVSGAARVTGNLGVKIYTETIAALGNITGATPINWSSGSVQSATLTGAVTLSFSGAVAGQSVTLYLTQDATGTRTIAWPGSIKWAAGGVAPTISTTATYTDIISFFYDGTTYWGYVSGIGAH